jgi:hypothetical protein
MAWSIIAMVPSWVEVLAVREVSLSPDISGFAFLERSAQ